MRLLANEFSMTELVAQQPATVGKSAHPSTHNKGRQAAPTPSLSEGHQEPTWEVVVDERSGPATIPGSLISEVLTTPNSDPSTSTQTRTVDLINHGVITLEQTRDLFQTYSKRLDHYMYRILGDHISLESVRACSPLLTAAVCTVWALHCPEIDSQVFGRCYRYFSSSISARTFSMRNTSDDVRALCMGAFWPSDLSCTLVATAVRVATELHLHRSISAALLGHRPSYFRTRLWYHVYVWVHHFSVAYGRPAMVRDCQSIQLASRFLESKHAVEDDARLVSQVKIWSTSSRVSESFGFDTDTSFPTTFSPNLGESTSNWTPFEQTGEQRSARTLSYAIIQRKNFRTRWPPSLRRLQMQPYVRQDRSCELSCPTRKYRNISTDSPCTLIR